MFTVPPAVALLNYISCGILQRIFSQTGIFAGFSLRIKYCRKDQRSCDGQGVGIDSWAPEKVYKQALLAKGHKNTNAPLILKIRDIIFFCFILLFIYLLILLYCTIFFVFLFFSSYILNCLLYYRHEISVILRGFLRGSSLC